MSSGKDVFIAHIRNQNLPLVLLMLQNRANMNFDVYSADICYEVDHCGNEEIIHTYVETMRNDYNRRRIEEIRKKRDD